MNNETTTVNRFTTTEIVFMGLCASAISLATIVSFYTYVVIPFING